MNQNNQFSGRVNKIAIVGGGTAGWMTAAVFAKILGKKNYHIQLIESEEIGTIGVGEAAIPSILALNKLLGIDEVEFMRKTQATFKVGIEFVNWGRVGDSYMHSFGAYGVNMGLLHFYNYWLKLYKQGKSSDIGEFSITAQAALHNKFIHPVSTSNTPLSQIKYAYHFDAGLYARHLRAYAESMGVSRIESKIIKVNLNNDDGFIKSLVLQNESIIEADLYIDCSGFKGILIEESLKTGYEDWSHLLLCDSAIAVQSKNVSDPPPYTRATAHTAGWQWRIPLQKRTGNGHVYASRFMDDDTARRILIENIDGDLITEPRLIRFKTGMRRKFWNKNCVAIGLSSGFIEPLESTSIHLIQKSIATLFECFPTAGFNQVDIDKYNDKLQSDLMLIRDFVLLHYKATSREDSEFWRHCKNMVVNQTLQNKIALFEESGKIFRDNNELFTEESWIAVMAGQGLSAKDYNPLVDSLDDVDLERMAKDIKSAISNSVSVMPTHKEFIANYCPQMES
ncbi:tryptophan halogenase family protein [Cellvibrio sp. pealriver]|uniref:tryptophan halogenase family protein n=1 Tax=Cellvibrio sp. pealriver TaxID=1622269 RepID=UPI00066FD51E|nr:tryptophan halogenase family protein [Cellvibrio sp. pealriver]